MFQTGDIEQQSSSDLHSSKFFQIKRKLINDSSSTEQLMLVQIIDVSHKIHYLDMRSQQHIFTLINAMVSHELRNPLNAILGQLLKFQQIRIEIQKLVK